MDIFFKQSGVNEDIFEKKKFANTRLHVKVAWVRYLILVAQNHMINPLWDWKTQIWKMNPPWLYYELQDKAFDKNVIFHCSLEVDLSMFICDDTACNDQPKNYSLSECYFDERASCFDSFLIFCHREMFTKLSEMLLKCVWCTFMFFHNVCLWIGKDVFNPAVACSKFHHWKNKKPKTFQPLSICLPVFICCIVCLSSLVSVNVMYIDLLIKDERSKIIKMHHQKAQLEREEEYKMLVFMHTALMKL